MKYRIWGLTILGLALPFSAIAQLTTGFDLNFEASDPTSGIDGNNWNSTTADSSQDFDFGTDVTLENVSGPGAISKAYGFTGGNGDTGNPDWSGKYGEGNATTWAFWLKPADTGDAGQTILESGGAGTGFSIWYSKGTDSDGSGTINFTIDGGNGTQIETVRAEIDAADFRHVTMVYNESGSGSIDVMQIYVDGVMVDDNLSATTSDDASNDNDNTGIDDFCGGDDTGFGNTHSSLAETANGGQFEGDIAIFRVWGGKALTDTEVLANYQVHGGPGSPIEFSDLAASNITTTAASLYATVNTNLTSCLLVWDTSDKGEDGAWANTNNLGSQTAGPVTGNATSLSADTLYSYRFYGEDSAVPTNAWSQAETFATDLTAAQTPVFTGATPTYNSVALEWTDNAATETGYILQRSTNGVDFAIVAELDENVTTHTDEGLLSGTTYHYQLAATNEVNQSSTAFSACVTNTTTLIFWSAMGASNIATATASPYATVSADLTASWMVWDTSDKGDTDLQLWDGKSGDMGPQSAGEVTGSAISLTPDTQYFFRFYGESAETYGWSPAATFATDLTSAQEPAFTSTDASFYSITLEWADNAATETGYVLQRSINGADYAVVAELGADVTTHTDRGLLTGTTYYYQLAATNDVNESGTAFSACGTSAATAPLAAPWTPAYTNTALWLDAADASTVLTSGSSVTNWSDKSGNGRDATQDTATKQPAYNATGFSGGPTLAFASGDEMLAGIAPNTFSSAIGVYMVLEKHGYTHYASYPFLRISNGKAAPFNGRWSDSSNGYWNYRYVGDGSAQNGFGRFSNFPAIDTPLLLSVEIDATTYTEVYNAVNAWSGAHGGTYGDTASDVIIGRNGSLGYSISEVVITDSILSAEARQTMEGYLAWKWGMESNLPAGHLYKDAPPLAPEPPPPAGTMIILR